MISNASDCNLADIEAIVEEGTLDAAIANESLIKSVSNSSKIRNILVVDDSTLNRKIICRLLRSAGYSCIEASDGQDCIDVLERLKEGSHEPIDLILMDSEMPRMRGPAATTTLRNLGYSIPVIGITGNVLKDDKQDFINHGASKVLHKPITLSALEASIEEISHIDEADI